ncbi:hypothetical protein Tb10.6k15.2990 [Trypanosoma brucei brucei TREU927]|uniref:Uncharacterized protein n=1 Tax=Trypanosoma brucei brucei (strain 927/4 GUTat10.1) TaxID=185431 RepID=Q38AJ9_TRYB2|nr:hypothetical protein Tb10.6k15.2990 [Trypanosoma brucei brucei TREU927]EAN78171.1 hypothetical protein Tb10.6k15.2990 [Trypanosoma brucei brucei TREU927]
MEWPSLGTGSMLYSKFAPDKIDWTRASRIADKPASRPHGTDAQSMLILLVEAPESDELAVTGTADDVGDDAASPVTSIRWQGLWHLISFLSGRLLVSRNVLAARGILFVVCCWTKRDGSRLLDSTLCLLLGSLATLAQKAVAKPSSSGPNCYLSFRGKSEKNIDTGRKQPPTPQSLNANRLRRLVKVETAMPASAQH